MIYPNHRIRTYCIYLGSLKINNDFYDMGVYIHPNKSVSHAIVFGDDNSNYISGEFVSQGEMLPDELQFPSFIAKINLELYKEYIKNPSNFPQPSNFKQRS
jgi:hypothetical protein